MKKVLTVLYVCLSFPCFAQKNDTVICYLDQQLNFTDATSAMYTGRAIRNNDHWKLNAVYKDNTPVLIAYFKDKKLTTKDGPYTVYFPNNTKALSCTYHYNKLNGLYESWYQNGQKQDSGVFDDDQYKGQWNTWFTNGILINVCNYKITLDAREKKQAMAAVVPGGETNYGLKEGEYYSWYTDGKKESAGYFRNDLMEGRWTWYYENGQTSTIEEYQYGKLVSLECFDADGNSSGSSCSILKPAMLKDFGDYREYINKNLNWPPDALKKRIEGTVKVRIKISKNGELENLILESNQELLKKAVAEVFQTMKEWEPAISHNRPVEWEDEMVIPFRLPRN
jgi:TonB family protein